MGNYGYVVIIAFTAFEIAQVLLTVFYFKISLYPQAEIADQGFASIMVIDGYGLGIIQPDFLRHFHCGQNEFGFLIDGNTDDFLLSQLGSLAVLKVNVRIYVVNLAFSAGLGHKTEGFLDSALGFQLGNIDGIAVSHRRKDLTLGIKTDLDIGYRFRLTGIDKGESERESGSGHYRNRPIIIVFQYDSGYEIILTVFAGHRYVNLAFPGVFLIVFILVFQSQVQGIGTAFHFRVYQELISYQLDFTGGHCTYILDLRPFIQADAVS